MSLMQDALTEAYDPSFLAISPRDGYTHVIIASPYFIGCNVEDRLSDIFSLMEWECPDIFVDTIVVFDVYDEEEMASVIAMLKRDENAGN